MPLVEDITGRPRLCLPAACGVDHDQRMIGNDDIRLHRRARRMFDEAFPVMRAARIDTFAAPVGQRGRAVTAKQGGQPAGQVTPDHVAIGGVGRPARDQLRQHRRASSEPALQRILQIEQAQIILAALAGDDAFLAQHGIGEDTRGLAAQLALQRLGIGGYPHRAARALGPETGGGEIAERLADAGPRLG